MNAHDQLDQAGQSQEEKDGGKCHMVGKVYPLTLVAFELNKAVAGTVQALAVARTIGLTGVVIHLFRYHYDFLCQLDNQMHRGKLGSSVHSPA